MIAKAGSEKDAWIKETGALIKPKRGKKPKQPKRGFALSYDEATAERAKKRGEPEFAPRTPKVISAAKIRLNADNEIVGPSEDGEDITVHMMEKPVRVPEVYVALANGGVAVVEVRTTNKWVIRQLSDDAMTAMAKVNCLHRRTPLYTNV